MVTSGNLSQEYNGEGLRVLKTVGDTSTRLVDEYDKVVLELDGLGNQKARNMYGTNLVARTVVEDTLYYQYNGHGDVTALLNKQNIAKGKTVTRSLSVTNAVYATDGVADTSKYAAINPSSDAQAQWFKLDLGKTQSSGKVKP